MNEIPKIVAMLEDEAVEKRIAAAIVLGEIRAKGPEVVEGLRKLVDSPVPSLQRHALDALAHIGAKRHVASIFPLLVSKDAEVRRAAARAIASVGEDVVPLIRKRMATAEPQERHALDTILAELGGTDAFATLLASMASSDAEAAKNAAIAVRQYVKTANAQQRRGYLAATERFLKEQSKGQQSGVGNGSAIAAAIKILGYLEDAKALPTLMEFATSKAQPTAVKQEALIALRFAIGQSSSPEIVAALIDAAADPDRTIAQTALHTLGSLELSPEHAKRLEALVAHPDVERARFVIEQLGRQKGAESAKLLVKVMATADKRRAELAAAALAGHEEAAAPLAKALLETSDADRAWMIRNVVRPVAKKIPPALRKQLLEEALERLGTGERKWEALLDVAREADPDAASEALRAVATKLRRQGTSDKALSVFSILCKSERATDDDRYARASLELAKSLRDTRPASRAGDEALKTIESLLDRGYDVAKALRKDKHVDLEHLYYVGFHFAEEGHPIGEELLAEVAEKGGRAKIGKMAKNKLALLGANAPG